MDDFCVSEIFQNDNYSNFNELDEEGIEVCWGINVRLNPEKISGINIAIQVSNPSGIYCVKDERLSMLISPAIDVDELVKNMDFKNKENFTIVHNYCARRLRAIVTAIRPETDAVKFNKHIH